MTDFGLKINDLEIIKSIFDKFPAVSEAIIFGSRAKGNYKNGSDVDIALKGDELNSLNVTEISYLLNEETNLPYQFDILNYHQLSSNELIEHIDRVGISFYRK